MASKRTFVCRVDEIERLRVLHGLTIERLAAKAGFHQRTIERALQKRPLLLTTIGILAQALGTDPDALVDTSMLLTPSAAPRTANTHFRFQLALSGTLSASDQAAELARLAPEVIARLQLRGITVSSHDSTLLLADEADGFSRRLLRIYGPRRTHNSSEQPQHLRVGEEQRPGFGPSFYVYAAIRPSKYQSFLESAAGRTLRLELFDAFGELIGPYDSRTAAEILTGPSHVPALALGCTTFHVEAIEPWWLSQIDIDSTLLPADKSLIISPEHLDATLWYIRVLTAIIRMSRGVDVLDNMSVAILHRINNLAERYGVNPCEIVITLDRADKVNSVLSFEVPPADDDGVERYISMLAAIGMSEQELKLVASDKAIYDLLGEALARAPSRRLGR